METLGDHLGPEQLRPDPPDDLPTEITEAVFAWPGLGTLAVAAINGRDYAVLQGIVLFSALVVVALGVTADLVQAALDPRAPR